MVQGTSSGAGKSVLTAALCRIFARAGYRVAPFKSQTMALNAAVTAQGEEIGRAQAAQAAAAFVEPTVDMNPILLKPESDRRSQVVVRGRAVASIDFAGYRALTPSLLPLVEESLDRLRRAHDLVVIEGAGSPAEVNVNDGEIVNMRIARMADAPVLLVGDIDRGGVLAAFVGTMALLDPDDRRRVAGFVVNRFRGDPALLAPGLDVVTARTGVPVLGVVPYVDGPIIPAEDSLDLDAMTSPAAGARIEIAVLRLPRIANFDDFEPLAAEPGVRVTFARRPADLERADLIVVPGSKSTIADLRWVRASGLAAALLGAAAQGRPVLGVCGGYQMLGAVLRDPDRVESDVDVETGLGLLPVVTTFERRKTTLRVRARPTPASALFRGAAGALAEAYEIHAGRTVWSDEGGEPAAGRDTRRPFAVVARAGATAGDLDGATSPDGSVTGTYLHGLFSSGPVRRALLEALAGNRGIPPDPRWGGHDAVDPYDRLADVVGAAVDVAAVARLVGFPDPRVAASERR